MSIRPNQVKKQEWVDEFRRVLNAYSVMICLDPRGIKAAEDRMVRKRLKAIEAPYRLIKNRLTLRSLQGTTFQLIQPYMRDMTAVALHKNGPELAKVIQELNREIPNLHFRAAIVDGHLFTEKQLNLLATLPSRPLMQARVLGILKAPPGRLVRLLAMPMILFLSLINKVKEQRSETIQGGTTMAQITKDQVVEYLSNLTVIQLMELVKELESQWGVEAATAMPVHMPAAGVEAAEPTEEKQVTYKVVITDAGQQKVQLIRVLREIFPQLGLKDAKAMVDQVPKTIKEGLSHEDAEDLKAKLTQVGASVEIQ